MAPYFIHRLFCPLNGTDFFSSCIFPDLSRAVIVEDAGGMSCQLCFATFCSGI